MQIMHANAESPQKEQQHNQLQEPTDDRSNVAVKEVLPWNRFYGNTSSYTGIRHLFFVRDYPPTYFMTILLILKERKKKHRMIDLLHSISTIGVS